MTFTTASAQHGIICFPSNAATNWRGNSRNAPQPQREVAQTVARRVDFQQQSQSRSATRGALYRSPSWPAACSTASAAVSPNDRTINLLKSAVVPVPLCREHLVFVSSFFWSSNVFWCPVKKKKKVSSDVWPPLPRRIGQSNTRNVKKYNKTSLSCFFFFSGD